MKIVASRLKLPERVIVAGARGLIGTHLTDCLKSDGVDVLELDLTLGHDLSREEFVQEWFAAHPAPALINTFAMNDAVDDARAPETLFDVSLCSFERYLAVNLTALFSVCRQYAQSNSAGSIVNFTSMYGIVSPYPDMYERGEKHIAYGVSKAGVIQMTRHLAVHLAPRFRVNCIAPGGVEHEQSTAFKSAYASRAPMRRMMAVEELYGAVAYLISASASYCTGSVLTIDGGWTAW